MNTDSRYVLCLMGPTASGKTHLAIQLAQQLPCDIISVDSAMVYRDMDIGTAKPTAEELAIAPHQLISMIDPALPYSAGQFCIDADAAIRASFAKQRIPLLVGGTMLYFRALQKGLSALPSADAAIREQILQDAKQWGWTALHQRLQIIDPIAAKRIHANDPQRIGRALEIYALTGLSHTEFCQQSAATPAPYSFVNIGLMVSDREELSARIEKRFKQMLSAGLIAEVAQLKSRPDLNIHMPAMRAVGYQQVWDYLADQQTKAQMCERAIIATRQLAKRQMTWLRHWPAIHEVDAQSDHLIETVLKIIVD